MGASAHPFSIDNSFAGLNIDTFLNEYETGKHGFNDQLITSLCKYKNITLITHNKDFIAAGVKVLTANKRLLKAKY